MLVVVTGPVGKLFGNLESYPFHNSWAFPFQALCSSVLLGGLTHPTSCLKVVGGGGSGGGCPLRF